MHNSEGPLLARYRMNPILIRLSWLVILGLSAACAPTSAQLKQAIEADPDIVYSAFRADPEKFLATMTAITAEARAEARLRDIDEMRKSPKSPVLTSDRAFIGTTDAPIVIVEYSDLQCPFCARGHDVITQLLAEYPDSIRVYFKHNPLKIHPQAVPAARMYEAIALQDKAKAGMFISSIFRNPDALKTMDEQLLLRVAESVGADVSNVMTEPARVEAEARIRSDVSEAASFGFSVTPSFLINGVPLVGAQPIAAFKAIIDRELAARGNQQRQ